MIRRDPDGATPLDPDEADGLIPYGITTRAELNAWEQDGIRRARVALLRSRRASDRVLDASFLRRVHREMFGSTWTWAGRDGLRHAAACQAADHLECPTFRRLMGLATSRRLQRGPRGSKPRLGQSDR